MSTRLQSEEDRAFIRAILSMPGDVAPRLVYADWLDEQDTEESRRAAEFLRVLARLTQTPAHSPRMSVIKNTLRHLEKRLPFLWVATLDVPLIEACAEQFQFVCPKQWDQLISTDESHVRHCDQCNKDVYFCRTVSIATEHALANRCVAILTSALRRENDLTEAVAQIRAERMYVLGTADGAVETVVRGRIALPTRNRNQAEE